MAGASPRVAVLGGGLTAATFVDHLSQRTKASIAVFPNIFDPVEPRWVFGTQAKPYVDYVPEFLSARGQAFQEQLTAWQSRGWVKEALAGAVRAYELGPEGPREAQQAAEQKLRVEPVGGAMELCQQLLADVAARPNVRHVEDFPARLDFDPAQKVWTIPHEKGCHGPFDLVLLSYDFCYRMNHVKAFRELLDSAMPHSARLIGSYGELHAGKCIGITFSADPPLGPAVPFEGAVVRGIPELRVIQRVRPCHGARWRRPANGEVWRILSSTDFSREVFAREPRSRTPWDKPRAGARMIRAFSDFVQAISGDGKAPDVRFQQNGQTYHWDLPVPLNLPGGGALDEGAGSTGVLLDRETGIGWMGDFCSEPTPEGCFLSGVRAAATVAGGLQGRWADEQLLLPPWQYAAPREGDEDLAALCIGMEPRVAAYRGTCNWTEAEKLMLRRIREEPQLRGRWIDHLPFAEQAKLFQQSAAHEAPARAPRGYWRPKSQTTAAEAVPAPDPAPPVSRTGRRWGPKAGSGF